MSRDDHGGHGGAAPTATRRLFLVGAASLAPGIAMLLAGCKCKPSTRRRRDGNKAARPDPLDRRMLEAAAAIVLPSSIGAAGCARAVGAALQWLSAYRAGTRRASNSTMRSRHRRSPPAPTVRYRRQLRALDATAKKRHGQRFHRLDETRRRALVREALDRAVTAKVSGFTPGRRSIEGLWAPHDLVGSPRDHVLLWLMSCYYWLGTQGSNLVYGAKIDEMTCRPLSELSKPPAPLTQPGKGQR